MRVTGCFDVARVDLRLDMNADDKPHVIEINM
jgi:D-alanine-D-alanine ligase-like ATP-grasp enzyme